MCLGRRPSRDSGRDRLSPLGQVGHFMDQQFLWAQFMPLKKISLGKLDMLLEHALGRPLVLECKGILGARGQDVRASCVQVLGRVHSK